MSMESGEDAKSLNRGEWAEAAAKCHFIIHGSFVDGLEGSLIRFDAMRNGNERLAPMDANPARYKITKARALELYHDGIATIDHGSGRSFNNPPLQMLCAELGIEEMKAQANMKPDIILYNISAKSGSAYFIEYPGSSPSSFVNASKTTRITYIISKADGSELSADDRRYLLDRYSKNIFVDGHRRVKVRVEQMKSDGFGFTFYRIKHDGFRINTKGVGHEQLACLCMGFLSTPNTASMKKVLAVYRNYHPDDFKRIRKEFLAYIRECILDRGPSKESDERCEKVYSEGMIFLVVLSKGIFKLYRASNNRWWEDEIEAGAAFDTPDAKRHDYGYVFEEQGKLLFDYALGIRGSFKRLLEGG